MFGSETRRSLPRLLIALTLIVSVFANGAKTSPSKYPTRKIAGISVVDTPLIRAAEKFAKQHSNAAVYKHLMRSWLYGVLMVNANETLSQSVDMEVHAVAVLLHDLGWDTTGDSTLISKDRRFEVDGAIAARDFIRSHKDGKHWKESRVQLVWDGIALHTERTISFYKELDVQVLAKGIGMDFAGPAYGVAEDDYAAVAKAFPKYDLKSQVNSSIILLCETKPQTTYDTWMQPFGEHYVEGYAPKGKQRFDLIFQNLTG
ncbi:hypothetical protein CDV36_008556 [Fusarium kuroshium]|uniref:HD domain-containing protein n=2 Tax=Fusarium solani species complex TaxID=232080 RepID=A0A3M2S2P2_9HYPO|nr:hypothetical protein CDV36_008556 [Fusarium kuroshium]RSL77805.1 hypothetical protein CEP51_008741 [Fusarium floridanum]